jgi:hypothetical protein
MDSNTVTIHFFLFSRRKIFLSKKGYNFLFLHSNSLLPFGDWALFVEE